MKNIKPPLIYKIFIGLMILSLVLPIPVQIAFPLNLIGILPFVFGTHMAVKSKRLFKKTNTPMHPFANPTHLHKNGFFKYSRHPMYLGIAIGLFGIAILTGIILNIAYAVIFLVICDIFFVRPEEKTMLNKFGEKYEEYKRETRRWI